MDAALSFPLLADLIAVACFWIFSMAANSIAIIVSTRVLRPQYAVLWAAAFFNFIAFLFFGLHVAETLGTGIIDATIVTPRLIFAALVGGLVGAGLVRTGLMCDRLDRAVKDRRCDLPVTDDCLLRGTLACLDRFLDLRPADTLAVDRVRECGHRCGRRQEALTSPSHLRLFRVISRLLSLSRGKCTGHAAAYF